MITSVPLTSRSQFRLASKILLDTQDLNNAMKQAADSAVALSSAASCLDGALDARAVAAIGLPLIPAVNVAARGIGDHLLKLAQLAEITAAGVHGLWATIERTELEAVATFKRIEAGLKR